MAMKMQTAIRKITRPRMAALVMSLPQDELTAWTVTSWPKRDSSASATRICSVGLSSPVRMMTDRVPPAPTICGVVATSAPAASAASWACAGSTAAAWNWNAVPPENSMPRLKPRKTKLPTQSSSSATDTQYHRLRLPMKSKTASPALSRRISVSMSGLLGRHPAAGGPGGGRRGGGRGLGRPLRGHLLHRAEPGEPRRHEGLAARGQGDDRMGEEEDDDQVEDRRHAEGEGEALHVARGQVVEDRGGEEGHRVRGQDRPPGPDPGPRHRRAR